MTSVPEVQACYCPCCKELTAYIISDSQPRYVASYTWNPPTRQWLLTKSHTNESDQRLADVAVAGLPGQWIAASSSLEMADYVGSREMADRFRRKLRLFCCAVIRQLWSALTDERLRRCVEISESFADGHLGQEEMGRTFSAFLDASEAIRDTSVVQAAYYAVYVPSLPHECLVAASKVTPSGEAVHMGLLRDIFGMNPLRPPTVTPAWLTIDAEVMTAAESAYHYRRRGGNIDNAKLVSLADLLDERGCRDADILGHLRGPGPHVRGCWCVDLLLAKQ